VADNARSPLPPESVQPLDLDGIQTIPIGSRIHKVNREAFGRAVEVEASAAELLDSLPDILAVQRLRELGQAIADARAAGRRVLVGIGGHVIKVGLGPLLIDMVRRGLVTDLALNGSAAIHDVEIALVGKTSEHVSETIIDGRFGMVQETAEIFGRVFRRGAEDARGLGRALAEELDQGDYPYRDDCLVHGAVAAGATLTVHVALGTDTVHAVPGASGAAIGESTHIDFRRLAAVVSSLSGGVYINVGSAVVLPEVFLKATSVARNLGFEVDGVTAANMDMIQHYRPRVNVLQRPASKGIELTGHHELMLPLVRMEALRRLTAKGGPKPVSALAQPPQAPTT
jgi:hypothetical protein